MKDKLKCLLISFCSLIVALWSEVQGTEELQGIKPTNKSVLLRSTEDINLLSKVSDIVPLTYSMLSYEVEQAIPTSEFDISYIKSKSGQYRNPVNFGFVAASKEAIDPLVIVAFRGTQNLNDYLTDVTFCKTDIGKRIKNESLNGYFCHKGFCDTYSTSREKIINILKSMKTNSQKNTRIVLVGHSLGAGLAQIAALDVLHTLYSGSNINNNVQIISLASPRVFDQSAAEYFDKTIGKLNHLRFANEFDVVTKIPMGINLFCIDLCTTFKHTGIEIPVPPYRFILNTTYYSLVNYVSELKKLNMDYYADIGEKIIPVICFYFASEYLANKFGESISTQALKYLPGFSTGVFTTIQALHNSSTYSEYIMTSFKEFKEKMHINKMEFEKNAHRLRRVLYGKERYLSSKEALAIKTELDDNEHASQLEVLVQEMKNKKPGFLDSSKRLGKGVILSATGLVCLYKSGVESLIMNFLGNKDYHQEYKPIPSSFPLVNDYNFVIDYGLMGVGATSSLCGVYEIMGGTKDMLSWGWRRVMGETDRVFVKNI